MGKDTDMENEELTDAQDSSESSSKANSYRILGLEPGVPDNVVKNKYGALIRQYKQKTDEYGVTDEDAAYYEKITRAYDDIMGITHDFSFYDPSSSVPYGLQKFWSKVCAFCDQYNVLLITLGILVVGGIIFAVQIVSNGKEDLTIKFVGAYGAKSENALKDHIDKKSEAVDNVQLSFYTVTTGTSFDQSSQSQATAFLSQLMAGSLDVVLIDKESFDVYVSQKAFKDIQFLLDEYYSENPDAMKLRTYRYASGKGDKVKVEEGVYGIDVTDSAFFEGSNLAWLYDKEHGQDKSMILAFCNNTEKSKKAEAFAKELFREITVEQYADGDLSLYFAGAYDVADEAVLKAEIDKKSEIIKDSGVSFYTVTEEISETQIVDLGKQLKDGNFDIVLMDKALFDIYTEQDVFMDIRYLLDEYYSENTDASKLKVYTYTPESQNIAPGKEYIYGIDVTDSSFFDETSLEWIFDEENDQEKSMILTVCRDGELSERAEGFVKELFKAIQ